MYLIEIRIKETGRVAYDKNITENNIDNIGTYAYCR